MCFWLTNLLDTCAGIEARTKSQHGQHGLLSLHTGAPPHEVGMGASQLQRSGIHGP